MRRISIQDLKAQLSGAIAEAAAGGTIVITKHNEPVARLVPAEIEHVHRGSRTGEPLRPATKAGSKGRYLDVLAEDRGQR